jgi:hypothetical protein
MDSNPNPSLEFENWEVVAGFLPAGWAEQARRLGAIRRTRYNSDPAVILRVLLLHLACGCSLAETAARASASGLAKISAVGVFKRLKAAAPWFQWLAQQLRGSAELPLELLGRRVLAVDASSVSEPGSTGSDWKVQYALNLADLRCDYFELTDIRHGGETFRRVPVQRTDIVLGDRVYASPPGVAHVVQAGGDVIVRLNRQALPLYDEQGLRMNLLEHLKQLGTTAPQEYKTRVKAANGYWINGRLIALRQSQEATRRARQKLKRRVQRSRLNLTAESLEYAEYFMLWTSLPESLPKSQILELYRLRWQVELVFKRMKSILGLGHLPKKDPRSAQAWLAGKLFVGLLVERMIAAAKSISPWGYSLEPTPQPVARS